MFNFMVCAMFCYFLHKMINCCTVAAFVLPSFGDLNMWL